MADKIVKVLDNHGERHSGVCSYVSFERLVAAYLQREVCRTGEKIVQLEVDSNGIKFYIERVYDYFGPDQH